MIYDSFNNGTYFIDTAGNFSPNGLWKLQFNGLGGGTGTGNGTEAYDDPGWFQQPKAPVTFAETHAALLTSTFGFQNATFSVDMKTVSQIRQGDPPKAFETAWFFWNWTDNNHQYYVTLKTSGFEIGKVDNAGQKFVFTHSTPKVNINNWQNVTITATNMQTSTPHIKALVDGVQVCDIDDTAVPNDAAMQTGGFLGLYCEVARAKFRNVNVTPI